MTCVCQGVVHLLVIEARNLRGADSSLIGHSRSDPYCTVQGICSRREQTALNRLLNRHTRLTHVIYLLSKDPARTRKHCKCILTFEHILCTCAEYEHNRRQCFHNFQLLLMLLHTLKCNILNCLTDINLLSKLSFLFQTLYSRIVLKVPLNPNQSGDQCST